MTSNGNASETKANESFDNGVFFDIEVLPLLIMTVDNSQCLYWGPHPSFSRKLNKYRSGLEDDFSQQFFCRGVPRILPGGMHIFG
jgi:hypothetical protein